MQKKHFFSFISVFLLLPILAGAVTAPSPPGVGWVSNIWDLVALVSSDIIDIIWLCFGTFSVISFIYAGYLFIYSHGEPGKIKGARDALIYGAVGIGVALLAEVIPYFVSFILRAGI